ncbi:MAG: TraI domain-containing protein [Deltaproteobacteria bacterium]|nr:TraI domain-containing protein [Deltaproteobacteria bacterium]
MVIERYANYVYLLPASEAHHHRGTGGLLRHGLEVAKYVLQESYDRLHGMQLSPRERKAARGRWLFATFVAGLSEDSAFRFAVRDQGPGIAASDLPHLFEIFYRGQREEDTQGFGLGLATVKRIIDGHGGHIWVETAPDRGSTSFSHFPMRRKVLEI